MRTTIVDNVLNPIGNVVTKVGKALDNNAKKKASAVKQTLSDFGKAVRGSVNGKINKRNTDADRFNAI